MTLRNFATKYGLPLNQVKAAVNVPKFATNDMMDKDYVEEELLVTMTGYYLSDMRACIERAADDNQKLKRIAELSDIT